MALKDAFQSELRHEASLTRKILERVPMDLKDWKPHEKSMSLGRLATHVVETIGWISTIQKIDDFDFLSRPRKMDVAENQSALLDYFDQTLTDALNSLDAMQDEDFVKHWVVRRGDMVIYDIPKRIAIRGWGFNHQFHHRGQLSVYLRLLNVPVPGMYGPSADEQ